ncbi:MAG: TetR/AcrR family transcriptional regulator [Proteobacteria bacterium]|nr:TetR/AcrR family transcriptional regulator [Pseudomonadota bacterium]MBU1581914.1 TetR/AcrR family transcriptional regulator [Pseudomonadota bacterium]MBU2456186.1 TetR/AcrR family transcriptional regulator [Pseudomonadota bacterium]MBU2631868.1 TetR/AcrR family transcriptional regulator [Pseudomonadota bacterium]
MAIADRKEREFKRREEDILQAAFDLFAEHGIESVTIEMIAEKAEVGKGTIYKHFTSKNDIFAVLIIRQGHELFDLWNSIPTDVPVLVQMKMTMRAFWDMQINDIRKFAVYRKCDQLLLMDDMPPEVLLKFSQQSNGKTEYIRKLIKKAVDEQIFKDASVDNFSAVVIGLFQGVLDLVLSGEIKPSEELYQLVENMVFKGFMR